MVYLFIFFCLFSSLGATKFVFDNEFLDFEALRSVSVSVYGGSDIGECLEACSNIKEGDDESWYQAWNQLAEKVEKRSKNFAN